MEMALSGDHYSAARMYEVELINEVVPEGKHLKGETGCRIAGVALATAATKKIMTEYKTWPHDEIWQRQRNRIGIHSKMPAKARPPLPKKRAPVWKGK